MDNQIENTISKLSAWLTFELSNYRRDIYKRGKYDSLIQKLSKDGYKNKSEACYELLEKVVEDLGELLAEQEDIIERQNQLIEGFVLGCSIASKSKL